MDESNDDDSSTCPEGIDPKNPPAEFHDHNQQLLKRKNCERFEASLSQEKQIKKAKKETLLERERKVILELGQLIDSYGYTIESLIGFGSFGSVLKVVNRSRINYELPDEKFYTVLKIIQVKSIEGSLLESMERVINRDFVNSFSNLEIYELIILSDYFIAIEMEYCQRGSLKALIANPLLESQGVYVDILLDLCNDLIELHDRNIIHRDIKPDNILIRDDINLYGLSKERLENLKQWKMKNNNIKRRDSVIPVSIADFGLAEEMKDIKRVAGTFKYYAPEIQSDTFENYSPKVDVYALGLTFKDLCEKCEHIDMDFIDQMLVYNPEQRLNILQVKENVCKLVKTETKVIEELQLLDGTVIVSLAFDGLFLITCKYVSIKSSVVSISQHETGPIFLVNTEENRIDIIGEIPLEWKRNIDKIDEGHYYISETINRGFTNICIYGDLLFISGKQITCQNLKTGQQMVLCKNILCPSHMSLSNNCLIVLSMSQYTIFTISGEEILQKTYQTCYNMKGLKFFQCLNNGLFKTIKVQNDQMIEEIRPKFWIEEMDQHQDKNMSFGETITTLEENYVFELPKIENIPLSVIEEVRLMITGSVKLHSRNDHSLIFKSDTSDDCVKVYPVSVGLRLNHHQITKQKVKFCKNFFLIKSRFYECGSLKDNMQLINIGHLAIIYETLTSIMFQKEYYYNLTLENIMVTKITRELIACEINPVFLKKHTDARKSRYIVGMLLVRLVFHCYGIEDSDQLTIEEIEKRLQQCIPKLAKKVILKLIGKNNEKLNRNDSLYQGNFTTQVIQCFNSKLFETFEFPNGKSITIPTVSDVPKIDEEFVKCIQNIDPNFFQEIPIGTEFTELSNYPNLAINPTSDILVTSKGDTYFQVYTKKKDTNEWQFVCEDSWNLGDVNSTLVSVKFIGEELLFFGISTHIKTIPQERIRYEHKYLIWRRVKLFIPRKH